MLTFEDFGHENGTKYWWASEYAQMLGYSGLESLKKPVNKAIHACMAAGIEYFNDFRHEKRIAGGRELSDVKLSKLACYLVAMNANPQFENVAKAQIYFADQVQKINNLLENAEELERLNIRSEIATGNVALSSAAKQSGVVNFVLFHDAGYRGLYNRGLKAVKEMKGIPQGKNHFDFMGRTELAANLFRITLTEEKLKQQPTSSEAGAKRVHQSVGAQVRQMVKNNTGVNPEQLPVSTHLNEVARNLKKASRELNKAEEAKAKKKKKEDTNK
jgi:DNA-damage-inducible protein D